MKKIMFNNEIFFLDILGVIYWPRLMTIILSDLHLGKSMFWARHGKFLPPYDNLETLSKLKKVLRKFQISKIIFLGDVFHDDSGYESLEPETIQILNEILCNYEIIFIAGNHDLNISIPKIKILKNYTKDSIIFSHYPSTNVSEKKAQIFGHFHPKISVKISGRVISKKCFVIDKKKILLPSFGNYTGGLDINKNMLLNIFKKDCTYFMLGQKRILEIKKENLKKNFKKI